MDSSPPTRFRLFYLDDSGSPQSGIVVYAWLEVDASGWRTGLESWLDLRHHLYSTFGIPASYRLHATALAGGHGNPSLRPVWNRSKHARREVMRIILNHIASTDGIAVGAAYRRTSARRDAYAQHRQDVYRRLVAHLDSRLATDHEHGLVFSDGDGSDPSYAAAHRALTVRQRRVVEDPQFPSSRRNVWLQLADLVAWTAFQRLHAAPNRRFAWRWYDTYLAARDVNGGPMPL
jgi:hypothetical protein